MIAKMLEAPAHVRDRAKFVQETALERRRTFPALAQLQMETLSPLQETVQKRHPELRETKKNSN